MRKSIHWFLALALVVTLLPTAAFAASPWTQAPTYGEKVKQKLEFGLDNLLLGWTEIFTEPRDYSKEHKCSIKGLGKGLWNALGQEVGGALHVVTFPILIDVPLPENGTQLTSKK